LVVEVFNAKINGILLIEEIENLDLHFFVVNCLTKGVSTFVDGKMPKSMILILAPNLGRNGDELDDLIDLAEKLVCFTFREIEVR
jgi:hypothetical protein